MKKYGDKNYGLSKYQNVVNSSTCDVMKLKATAGIAYNNCFIYISLTNEFNTDTYRFTNQKLLSCCVTNFHSSYWILKENKINNRTEFVYLVVYAAKSSTPPLFVTALLFLACLPCTRVCVLFFISCFKKCFN